MKNLYKVVCYVPYCGAEVTYWLLAGHEGDIPEEDLNDWVYEWAEEFAFLVKGWGEEDFGTEEDKEEYYSECGYDISGPYELDEAVEEGYCGLADAEY